MTAPKAPPHLSADSKRLYRQLVSDYALDAEPHALRVLALACEALDRAEEARLTLASTGTVFVDRFGQPRSRPEVNIERDSALRASRLFRELSLDGEVEARVPRVGGGRS